MAPEKKLKKDEFDVAEVRAETEVKDGKGNPVFPAPKSVAAPVSGTSLTFPMYCTIRSIPIQRQAGLRAFTNVQSASLTEWDAIFKKY